MPTAAAAPSPDKRVSAALHPPNFPGGSGRRSPRPTLSSSRPSWIGPAAVSRPATSGTALMSQKVKIHYSHPGLQPPVFVAGSVCEPEWHPTEMEYTEKDDGELHFWLEFDVEPGEYQYKFRLGPGDWWALDETKPIVDDGTGNRNHILKVEPRSASSEVHDFTPAPASAQAPEETRSETQVDPSSNLEQDLQDTEDQVPDSERYLLKHETMQQVVANEVPESEKHLLRHETMQHDIGVPRQEPNDEAIDDEYDDDEEPPLLDHEVAPAKRADSKRQSPSIGDPAEIEVEADDELNVDKEDDEDDDGGDDDDAEIGCPLFRHETMSADDADPEEAPLFRHESMSRNDSLSVVSGSPTSPKRHQFANEDVDDPSLEPFPTDQAGILARLQRAETRLPEDETTIEGTPPSPSLSQTKSFSPLVAPVTLVGETSDVSQRNLDAIDETDETDDEESSQPGDKKGSVAGSVPIAIKIQDVSEIPENMYSAAPPQDVSNRSPPTPPMTPDEHHQIKAASHDGSADTDDVPRADIKPAVVSRSQAAREMGNVSAKNTASKASIDNEGSEKSFATDLWSWFTGLCGGPGRATGVAIAVSVAAAALALNTRAS